MTSLLIFVAATLTVATLWIAAIAVILLFAAGAERHHKAQSAQRVSEDS